MPTAEPPGSVLLTGASQGIGRAILLSLARDKQPVVSLSRTRPELPDSTGSEFDYVAWKQLDLSNADEVARCATSLRATVIRALVLCAVDYGANERHPVAATSAQEWQRAIVTNCIGHSLLVSLLLPKLIANPPGIIVNLSSDVAVLPAPGRAAYAASKAGLHAVLRTVAAEHSEEQLRVYQLIPTFQSITDGIRRRRPAGFDFSGYADPALIAEIVRKIVSPAGSEAAPGTYLIQRDGTLHSYPEITHL
jgi:NAD(P)-dependent dehydrogenase (short-subunit alcohol dehydrogenase family)